jgi:sialate O-acetylesterase
VNALTPAAVFNAMIAPLTQFPIRGVIAYQGESDVDHAQLYRAIFSAQIKGWRAAWRREDLPFLFVQLAGYSASKPDPTEDAWAELREAQAHALRLPTTAMAVAADLGETDTRQPRNKRGVAERLMLAALAVAYRRSLPYSGPLFTGHAPRNGAIHLNFAHAESGLRGRQPGPPLSFAIAGADRAFRWADARIEQSSVIVSHPAIPSPVAVRYGWETNPVLTVENAAGLPMAPFRTDTWPGITPARA